MTANQFEELTRRLEVIRYNQWVCLTLLALAAGLAVLNLILKIVLYVRQVRITKESLEILRLSRDLQWMAREQKGKATQVLSQVSEAVQEVKQAVADGASQSQSGTKHKTVDGGQTGGV